MKNKLCISCLLTLLFILPGCTPEKAFRYGPALRRVFFSILSQYNGPGAVLAVRFDDGSIWTGAGGTARIGSGLPCPLTPSHRFRIGSVTKTFTGTAVLLLVQSGKLALEDTVESLLPGLIPGGEHVTVRMLLSHTSGLFDYTWDGEFLDRYTDNLTKAWDPKEDLIAVATAHVPVSEPGGEGIYSNTNYVLLGLIVEAVAGKTIEKVITESILEPLGLSDTTFPTGPSIKGDHAHGYLDRNGDGCFTAEEDVTAQHPSALWAAGAMVSTPGDLLSWIDELTDSRLLDEELQTERLAFSVPIAGHPNGYFGLGIAGINGAVGHTGAVPGYQTMLFRFRDTDFAVYCTGYLTARDSVNIAQEIYQAAALALFPNTELRLENIPAILEGRAPESFQAMPLNGEQP